MGMAVDSFTLFPPAAGGNPWDMVNFQSWGQAHSTTTSPVIDVPVEWENDLIEDDVIVTWLCATGVVACNAVADWDLISHYVMTDSTHMMRCLSHRVTAAEESGNVNTWTLTGLAAAGVNWASYSIRLRSTIGVPTLMAVNTSEDPNLATSANTATLPGGSIDGNGLVFCMLNLDATTGGDWGTIPAPWTLLQSRPSGGTGDGILVIHDDLTVDGVGIGSSNFVYASGADEYITMTVAFAPTAP